MPHPVSEAGIVLRALILEKAATPQGHTACDCKHLQNYKSSAKVRMQMVAAGLLHKAKVPTHFPRYFTTAEAVAHFIATTPPKTNEDTLAYLRARYAAKAKTVVKKPRAVKPKVVKSLPVKPPPEVKVLRPDYTKPAKPAKCSAEHIAAGKVPTKPAMTWNDRASFVLNDMGQIGKIKLLDVVLDGVQENGKDDDGFDTDAAIVTGELSALIPDLIEALGGELVVAA